MKREDEDTRTKYVLRPAATSLDFIRYMIVILDHLRIVMKKERKFN
jgi:hypothetical protein